MKPELLIVSPMPPRVLDALKDDFVLHDYHRSDDRPALLGEVGNRVRGYLSFASGGGADGALMDATPNVEIIANWGVGYDRIDADAAKERGIVLTNTPDVLTNCCADLAMALILAVARRVAEGDRHVRAGSWKTQGGLPLGTRVNGSRLGIVGLGRIGKAVAKRAGGFDMAIAYHGRRPQTGADYVFHDSVVSLAAASEFLILTCPGGPATKGLVGAEVLEALGPEGFLINVSRGTVVDETALIAALQAGTIAGAALDVFANEPNVPEALRAMDNVVLQPHQSSGTTATRRAMDDLVVENVRLHFAGKPVKTPVYTLP